MSIKNSRNTKTRVKTAKGRKIASTKWLERQLNDPYVQMAKKEGYRSRAAYKLIELDEQFKFLRKGQKVVDLGAAPGGWTQVAVKRCGAGNVVGIDILPIQPIEGAILLHKDFNEDDAPELLKAQLNGQKVDLVVSDIAPNTTGDRETDHIRILALCELAADFAFEVLKPGGAFVAKVWQGGAEGDLLKSLKQRFERVKHAKPKASRADSAETYMVALGFKDIPK